MSVIYDEWFDAVPSSKANFVTSWDGENIFPQILESALKQPTAIRFSFGHHGIVVAQISSATSDSYSVDFKCIEEKEDPYTRLIHTYSLIFTSQRLYGQRETVAAIDRT